MDTPVNILYIGNTSENQTLLSQNVNLTVTIAENALKAVNFLRSEEKCDAIICEMNIPGGDGFHLHSWVREQSRFASVPFILVAHEFSNDLFTSSFKKRIDDFFVTPLPAVSAFEDRIRFLINFRKKLEPVQETVPVDLKYRMPVSKRLFDIAVALGAILFLSPILILIMLAIKIESPGKVYYISKRVGRKPFDFYKLRSMRSGADAELKKLAAVSNQYQTESKQAEVDFSLPCPKCSQLPEGETCSPVLHIGDKSICDYWYSTQKKEVAKSKSAFVKISNDPRVTRVGKIIRNTSIDELPQLINVLKGDMSIVGNRPLPVYEAELLTFDTMSKRFLAPAGITGLWQVELRGRGGNMSEDERKRLDNEYADHFAGDNYSFWYDIKLILRTIPALFQKDSV